MCKTIRIISAIDAEVGVAAEMSLEFTFYTFRLSENNEFMKIQAGHFRYEKEKLHFSFQDREALCQSKCYQSSHSTD